MALYHKWDVKNDFTYVLTFYSLIFDGLGGMPCFVLSFTNFLCWSNNANVRRFCHSIYIDETLKYGFCKKLPVQMNLCQVEHFCPHFFSRSALICIEVVTSYKIHTLLVSSTWLVVELHELTCKKVALMFIIMIKRLKNIF